MNVPKKSWTTFQLVSSLFLATTSIVAAAEFSDAHKTLIQGRATQAVIWGMPAVNYDRMLQAMIKSAKGAPNQIVYWSGLPDWRNQTLTPNPDAIYIMPFFDTKDVGPIVLEIPAADGGSITGSIDDGWQTAIEDVGPAGVDKGKGGKYLILPPGYTGEVPEGHIACPSSTFQSYALLRSILKSGSKEDVAAAVEYAKKIKVYPLSASSTETKFNDAINIEFDATIPYDISFFQSLDRMVQHEPWLERDRAMIDQLKSIGIEKGKEFNPDAVTKALLEEGAKEAHAWLGEQYEAGFTPFFPTSNWALPVAPDMLKAIETNYQVPDSYPIDARGVTFSFGFFSAKHLGAGQYYLMTAKDAEGNAFDGGRSYRLTVPAHAPIQQYWSATLYDRNTHALIRDQQRASRSSQNLDLVTNPDGSVDLYFGPKAPAGKEGNWVPTAPDKEFEVLFRLYGPTKQFFDKKWVLPDVTKVE